MEVLGQFQGTIIPDSFVWLRGFSDMQARKRALESFYGGPVWKQHSRAASATMIDSDNVLLLRPVSGLELDGKVQTPPRQHGRPAGPARGHDLSARHARRRGLSRVLPARAGAGSATPAPPCSPPMRPSAARTPSRRCRCAGRGRLCLDGGPRQGRGHLRHLARLERSTLWLERSQALAHRLEGQAGQLRLRTDRARCCTAERVHGRGCDRAGCRSTS